MTPRFLEHPQARTIIGVPGEEHTKLFLKLQNEPESRQYLARYMPLSLTSEKDWIAKANTSPNEAVFVIMEKNRKKAIGSMGLHRIDWKNRRATTGTVILADYCNKGLGSDAKMLLLDWAFNQLGLLKVESRVIVTNKRSQAYSQKCGYEEVGRLKRHHFRDGVWQDEIIMEVHARKWRKLWEQFTKGNFPKTVVPIDRDRAYPLPG